ncbi:DOMON domain-containing protein [Mucilaginibacter ginkgonis]|uniref:YD repeat-containing protein n=1 Tax=Mucilaginibacter ginkgonis TaxID=2682091 RepID=A0A6I4I441_9SPHI|nr:hypothetical protein [Mucilaginibacter ginkgonis]QQL48760.1 hypothetical protein GO620_011285 [Mucilaginibacter ginkgonis]
MKISVYSLLASIALSLTMQSINAQSTTGSQLQLPPANIKIDGAITEWGDSLRYYNAEKKLNYSLANDTENIYVALRLSDRSEQLRVLRSGLTLSINTKGKKKEMYSMTFPVANENEPAALTGAPAQTGMPDDRDEMMRARLTKLRNIKVTGFPDIESDIITTANTYGIKAAITYDDNGHLNYEAAIPLKFFHADDIAKTEWAFNFRINGITRPANKPAGEAENQMGGRGGMGGGRGGMGGGGMRGGRGGMGGGMRGGGMQGSQPSIDRSEMSKSVDFWEKFYLSGN